MTKRRDTAVRQPTRWISTRVGVGQAKQFGRSKLLEQNSKSRAAGVWRSGGGLLFHVIGLSRCQLPTPAEMLRHELGTPWAWRSETALQYKEPVLFCAEVCEKAVTRTSSSRLLVAVVGRPLAALWEVEESVM